MSSEVCSAWNILCALRAAAAAPAPGDRVKRDLRAVLSRPRSAPVNAAGGFIFGLPLRLLPLTFSNMIIFCKEPRLLTRQARGGQCQRRRFGLRGRVGLNLLWAPRVPLPGGSEFPAEPGCSTVFQINPFFSIGLVRCPTSTSVHSDRECAGVGDLGRGPSLGTCPHSTNPAAVAVSTGSCNTFFSCPLLYFSLYE